MTYLQLNPISVRFEDGRTLFDHLQFSITEAKTALTGANGSGKSYLLHILAGLYPEYKMAVQTTLRCGMMYQRAPFASEHSMRIVDVMGFGQVYDALTRIGNGAGEPADFDTVDGAWDFDTKFSKALQRVALPAWDPAKPVRELNGGAETRLRLAAALLDEPDFLLLDEPTNHLDATQRSALLALLDDLSIAWFAASHDRDVLRKAEMVMAIQNGKIRAYGGNWDHYSEMLQLEETARVQHMHDLQKELRLQKQKAQDVMERQQRRMSAAARNVGNAGLPKIVANAWKNNSESTAASVKRAHEQRITSTRTALHEAKEAVSLRKEIRMDLNATQGYSRWLIEFNDVLPGVVADGIWDKPVNDRISSGERIRLHGANGTGKSHLLALISGEIAPADGEVIVHTEKIHIMHQTAADFEREEPGLDQERVWNRARRKASHTISDGLLRTRLARFLFSEDDLRKPVTVLSGGERMRLYLAGLFSDPDIDLLILDEPTNHLDLESRQALAQALAMYEGTFLVISHDEDFIRECKLSRTISLARSADAS